MSKRKLKNRRKIDILGIPHLIRRNKTGKSADAYFSSAYGQGPGLIEIDPSIKDRQEYLRVLLHECLHGVFQYTGVHQDITLPQEHAIIDSTITFLMANFDIELK
jgi:hypothetical protein